LMCALRSPLFSKYLARYTQTQASAAISGHA
jgi:hypothetical protein